MTPSEKYFDGIVFLEMNEWFVEISDGRKFSLGLIPHDIFFIGHDENRRVRVCVSDGKATFHNFLKELIMYPIIPFSSL